VLLAGVLAPGCQKRPETPTPPPQPASRAATPDATAPAAARPTRESATPKTGQKLTFGLYASDNPTALVQKFQGLVEYLSDATGYTVELKVAPSYAVGLQWIAKGEVDLFRSGINNYLELNRLHGEGKFPVVAREVQSGGRSFRGAIVVRNESPCKTLADLKGKRFAFGDRTSTMGSVIPKGMLKEAGVSLKDLKASQHFPSHDDVAVAVRVGEFDAGAVKEGTAKKFLSQGLRVLAWSPDMPTKPVFARRDLPEAAFEAVKKALIAMKQEDPDHARVIADLGEDLVGFMEGSYQEYAQVRSMVETEESEPETPKPGAPAVK
jgi:phosphonate transport system substrate-binding protein